VSACEKTSYKIMSAVYRDHPVTPQEALHLMAFFRAQDGAAIAPRPPVAPIGALVGVALVVGLSLAYRRPRATNVRKRLVRRNDDVVD
jgi:hypothetical protein